MESDGEKNTARGQVVRLDVRLDSVNSEDVEAVPAEKRSRALSKALATVLRERPVRKFAHPFLAQLELAAPD
jgi:hypothetical protein